MPGAHTVAYDTVGLKSEATNILNFAQTLEQQPTTVTNSKVAQWLQKGLSNKDYSTSFNNETVIEIARIIDNTPTTEVKVTALLAVLANQEAAALKDAKKHIKRQRKFAQEDSKRALIAGAILSACVIGYGYMLADLVIFNIQHHINMHDWNLLAQVKKMINASKTTCQI